MSEKPARMLLQRTGDSTERKCPKTQDRDRYQSRPPLKGRDDSPTSVLFKLDFYLSVDNKMKYQGPSIRSPIVY